VTDASDVAPVRPDEQLDRAVVAAYLRGKLPESEQPLEILQFPGGHANLTYLLRFGDREYVLRRPPLGPVAPRSHDMVREYRALAALGPYYAPAPRVFVLCEDPAVIGAPFFVMERRHGVVVRRTMPPEIADDPAVRRRIGIAAIDALADLHAVPVAGTPVAALGKPEGFVARQIHGWSERWQRAKTEELATMDALAAWLMARIPPALDPTVVHNDFKLDNMMLDLADPGRVVAVLDWDMTTLGDPLVDLGTLLNYLPDPGDPESAERTSHPGLAGMGLPERAEIVAHYARRAGAEVAAVWWWEAFALWKTVVVVQQLHRRWVRGESQDPRMAHIADRMPALIAAAQIVLDTAGA
jgi:aminoglycoside phosphotransferase (APT) family kinase protein